MYKGLGLKSEDLNKYDTPLMGFDGKVVVLEGQIKLLAVIRGMEVKVNFILVNAFSPYTAILGQPWIHAMGVIPSTLHQKVKFPTKDGVDMVQANQKVARLGLSIPIRELTHPEDPTDD